MYFIVPFTPRKYMDICPLEWQFLPMFSYPFTICAQNLIPQENTWGFPLIRLYAHTALPAVASYLHLCRFQIALVGMIARGMMLLIAEPLNNQAATFMLHQLQWLLSKDNPSHRYVSLLVGSGEMNPFLNKYHYI